MLTNLHIVHRRKPRLFDGAGAPVWATCLRSLAFAKNPADVQADAQDSVYSGAKAYAFLLEVACGLHSPIVGETEVFGQFKAFLPQWLSAQPEYHALAQRVLSDAKALRAKHLSKLGNQSYGSWLRKNVKAETVHILGGGHLAKEILPYLAKQNKMVHVHVRNPDKVDFYPHKRAIGENAFTTGALIIAAPMSAREINAWLNGKKPSQVFDLRDNSCTDAVEKADDHHGLKAIFTQIEQNKSKLVPVIEKVRTEIADRADKVTAQALVRPQGWDDLCA